MTDPTKNTGAASSEKVNKPKDPLEEGLAAAKEKLELYKGPADEKLREANLADSTEADAIIDADDAGE